MLKPIVLLLLRMLWLFSLPSSPFSKLPRVHTPSPLEGVSHFHPFHSLPPALSFPPPMFCPKVLLQLQTVPCHIYVFPCQPTSRVHSLCVLNPVLLLWEARPHLPDTMVPRNCSLNSPNMEREEPWFLHFTNEETGFPGIQGKKMTFSVMGQWSAQTIKTPSSGHLASRRNLKPNGFKRRDW